MKQETMDYNEKKKIRGTNLEKTVLMELLGKGFKICWKT